MDSTETELDKLEAQELDATSREYIPGRRRGWLQWLRWPKRALGTQTVTELETHGHELQTIQKHTTNQISRTWTIPRRLTFRGIASINQENGLGSHRSDLVLSSQTSLILAVTKEEVSTQPLEDACKWFISYLESKINECWVILFRPVLTDVDASADTPNDQELVKAFKVLEIIVKKVEEDVSGVALVTLLDELYNQRLFRYTDAQRKHASHLVFCALGWISCLYSPKYVPIDNTPDNREEFEIHDPFDKSSSRKALVGKRRGLESPLTTFWLPRFCRNFTDDDQNDAAPLLHPGSSRYRSKTIIKFTTALNNNTDQPLHFLIQRFGKTIPQPKPTVSHEIQEDFVEESSVNFRTLWQVAKVDIEWVDCLSLHMEFDSRTKVLRLFRFPSLCLIMGCREKSTLYKIFAEAADPHDSRTEQENDAEANASNFFKEVLMSYRLLFGQSRGSYRYFNNLVPFWKDMLDENPDPLLHILCGRSWRTREARSVFFRIDVEDPATHFLPSEQFPFLGTRILALHNHIRGHHNPSSLTALWYNRTNLLQWWTFWAVIIIGGGGLLLSGFQLIFSIMQVFYKGNK